MSEPKLISPLLDSFAMGSAISTHHGVSCYPAMKDGSDNRYIVKTVSIPASATQLEALLLSGAYPSRAAARGYFKELVNDIVNEVEVMRRLAKLEGFLPFLGYQVVPMEDGTGYQVYLLSDYRQSLEKFFSRSPMTHLGAVNLGIDLCSAMSVCRQAGCLYMDLKPSNIFILPDGRYCIGDLGLIPLSSLPYASLPDKYRSSWTAPEVRDAMSDLSETMDIYAIGLTLYQAYNNGKLPFTGDAPAEPLPPPEYADYEMSDIILRACAPDPKNRWQTPGEMGQALVAYMQRNGANNTPIVPPVVPQEPEQPEEEEEAPPTEEELAAVEAALSQQPEQAPAELPEAEAKEPEAASAEAPAEETFPAEVSAEKDASDEDEEEQFPDSLFLSFSTELDETQPSAEEDTSLDGAVLTSELTSMLAQADELLSHKTPDPVVAPEAIDVPMPEPIVLKKDEEEEDGAEDATEKGETEDMFDFGTAAAPEADPEAAEEPQNGAQEDSEKPRRSYKKLISSLLALVIAAALAAGGLWAYRNYYLQPVESLTLSGTDDRLTVTVKSPAEEGLLHVVCTDSYGTVKEAPVRNGMAAFEALTPNSHYSVEVKIDGFHRLTGQTSGTYATPPQTNIVSFIATAGSEDGSVILNFTVDGVESKVWNVTYSAEGEEAKTAAFSSHTATITGLTVGKEYTFRIEPEDKLFLTGTTELKFTAAKLVLAENLKIDSCEGSSLTLSWSAPEGSSVTEWTVRCYNENGYDKVITTADTKASFTDVDTSVPNTLEVTAEGMTKCSRTVITANPVTITAVNIFNSAPSQMTVEWEFSGKAPEGGWIISWSVDGTDLEFTAQTDRPSAVIDTVVPGMLYHFNIQTASTATVFHGVFNTESTPASPFEGFGAHAESMQFSMCRTPENEDWSHYDLSEDDYTTEFSVGEKASFVIYLAEEYEVDYTDVTTLFVFKDSTGKIIDLQTSVRPWVDMWYGGYCELDIPALPALAGSYSVDIYFNGQSVTTQSFVVR